MIPAKLITALNHPLGRRILRFYEDRRETASPRQLAEALGAPLAEVNRQIELLVEAGALQPTTFEESQERSYGSVIDTHSDWVRPVLESSRESDGDGRPE